MSDKQDAVGRNKEHASHVTWAGLFVLAKKGWKRKQRLLKYFVELVEPRCSGLMRVEDDFNPLRLFFGVYKPFYQKQVKNFNVRI